MLEIDVSFDLIYSLRFIRELFDIQIKNNKNEPYGRLKKTKKIKYFFDIPIKAHIISKI
jgi:hypothetical protein